MRKPDDDLKINISDIFGGDLTPSQELTEEMQAAAEASAPTATAQPSEQETRFQDWLTNRERELEAKAQELERRLQDMHSQLTAVPPVPVPVQEAPAEAIPAAPAEVVSPPEPAAAASPVDFDAPIAPPFMAGAPPPVTPFPATAGEPAGTTGESPDPQKAEELKKLQEDHEFLMLYDEFRNIIAHELIDLVGDKKTYTMLGRTVELARTKYPEIFRNANWDPAGNLLEDGSLDSQRVIENKNGLDAQKADLILDASLSTLLNLRLQAVEKGLGTGLKNKIRAHLYQWITEKIQKAGREGKDASVLRRLNAYVSQI